MSEKVTMEIIGFVFCLFSGIGIVIFGVVLLGWLIALSFHN